MLSKLKQTMGTANHNDLQEVYASFVTKYVGQQQVWRATWECIRTRKDCTQIFQLSYMQESLQKGSGPLDSLMCLLPLNPKLKRWPSFSKKLQLPYIYIYMTRQRWETYINLDIRLVDWHMFAICSLSYHPVRFQSTHIIYKTEL